MDGGTIFWAWCFCRIPLDVGARWHGDMVDA